MSQRDLARTRWSIRCLVGIHRWQLHNLAGGGRYRDCSRCGEADDAWFRGNVGL
jgi:hypothetical protein